MAFGDIVKVTPSSKVVGDMALFLVSHGMTVEEFLELRPDHNVTLPNSVVDMFCRLSGRAGGRLARTESEASSCTAEAARPGRPGEHLAGCRFRGRSGKIASRDRAEPTRPKC